MHLRLAYRTSQEPDPHRVPSLGMFFFKFQFDFLSDFVMRSSNQQLASFIIIKPIFSGRRGPPVIASPLLVTNFTFRKSNEMIEMFAFGALGFHRAKLDQMVIPPQKWHLRHVNSYTFDGILILFLFLDSALRNRSSFLHLLIWKLCWLSGLRLDIFVFYAL